MDNYKDDLGKYTDMKSINMWHPTRMPIFWLRFGLQSLLFKHHFKFPSTYNFINPGLEMKFALEEAEKQGCNVKFLGAELD